MVKKMPFLLYSTFSYYYVITTSNSLYKKLLSSTPTKKKLPVGLLFVCVIKETVVCIYYNTISLKLWEKTVIAEKMFRS